jgi:hypothetical protein
MDGDVVAPLGQADRERAAHARPGAGDESPHADPQGQGPVPIRGRPQLGQNFSTRAAPLDPGSLILPSAAPIQAMTTMTARRRSPP